MKTIKQVVLSISPIQHREKVRYFTDYLLQGVSVETAKRWKGRKRASVAKK